MCGVQTKGTGGDIIILEEAAYVNPTFSTRPSRRRAREHVVYRHLALTSEMNFYSKLPPRRTRSRAPRVSQRPDPAGVRKVHKGRAGARVCAHAALIPRWQDDEKHRRLKTIMSNARSDRV